MLITISFRSVALHYFLDDFFLFDNNHFDQMQTD